ncbi:MAG: 50S ribosomal protein L21 [Candidatus Zambryskibacteria bacterium]|nr:50S ribosomal protein L21 [Candidatus Zambryskibacteria bacterium]
MAEATSVKKPTGKAPVVRKAAVPKLASKSVQSRVLDRSLYAVFATGGKQYRVRVGDKVKIEKITGEHKEGDKLVFDKVLLVDDGASEATIGTPFITGAVVNATLNKIARYKTIDVIKYKQKSRYFKKYGHRQPYFEVQIDSIK